MTFENNSDGGQAPLFTDPVDYNPDTDDAPPSPTIKVGGRKAPLFTDPVDLNQDVEDIPSPTVKMDGQDSPNFNDGSNDRKSDDQSQEIIKPTDRSRRRFVPDIVQDLEVKSEGVINREHNSVHDENIIPSARNT